MNQIVNKLFKYEKILFFLVILLNLIPVFNHRFFPTLDGPAHLYNANLINHMLFHPDFDAFFQFNAEPIPNWTGHILLCFFKGFLPGFLAEKMLVVLYFIGLPYAFRNLVKSANGAYPLASYLIFPFTYNYLFVLGFYNFSFGIIGLFLVLAFWIRNHETISTSVKKIILLSFLLILIYFSHVLMFGIALLALACYTFITFLKQYTESGAFKEALIAHLRKAVVLLISSLIPFVLMFLYFANRPSSETPVFLSTSELFSWLGYMNPLICFSVGVEKISTIITHIALLGLVTAGIISRIRSRRSMNSTGKKEPFFRINDVWLLMCGVMLLLLFIMPDKNGMASLISMRFALLSFLFLVLWISTMKQAKILTAVCLLLILVFHVKRVRHIDSAIDGHNAVAVDCQETAKFIEPNSIVAPVNLTDHWVRGHFSNYLGIDKPLIILENYEATTDYFPLIWNKENIPDLQVGGKSVLSNSLFSSIPTNTANEKREIDYIFVLGDWDSSNTEQLKNLQLISLHFVPVHKNTNCTLYRRKITGS